MLLKYIDELMKTAHYEILTDDNSFYGEIPLCEGVYSNAETLEECRTVLEEVLEEWILLRIHFRLPLPVVNKISLEIKEVA